MPLDMHSNVTSYHKMGLIIMNNYLAQNQVLFFYKAKYENISLLIQDKPYVVYYFSSLIALSVIKHEIIFSVQIEV